MRTEPDIKRSLVKATATIGGIVIGRKLAKKDNKLEGGFVGALVGNLVGYALSTALYPEQAIAQPSSTMAGPLTYPFDESGNYIGPPQYVCYLVDGHKDRPAYCPQTREDWARWAAKRREP